MFSIFLRTPSNPKPYPEASQGHNLKPLADTLSHDGGPRNVLGAGVRMGFVFVQYPWRSSLARRRTIELFCRLWARILTPLGRGLFEFGSPFVEGLYSEWRLQIER